MECRDFKRLGRSLVATRSFNADDVVLTDAPVLHWDGDSLPADIAELFQGDVGKEFPTVPVCLIAAMAAYAQAPQLGDARRAVDDMCSPDVPLGVAAWELLECARVIARRFVDDSKEAAARVARAAMAAKVNAHRAPDGQWRLFPTASKLAHSCDPNTMYMPLRACFVAVRRIAVGELITFSYLGGPLLMARSSIRQSRLVKSHLFVCQCSRCRGEDLSRKLRCPTKGCSGAAVRRSSELLLSDDDAAQEHTPPWHCGECRWNGTDAELAPVMQRESEIEQVVLGWTSGGVKYKFGSLIATLTNAVDALGPLHWTVAAGCFHLGQYCWLLSRLARVAGGSADPASGAHVLRLAASCSVLVLLILQTGLELPVLSNAMPPHMLAAQTMILLAQDTNDLHPFGTPLPPSTGVSGNASFVQLLAAALSSMLSALYGVADPRSERIRELCPDAAAVRPFPSIAAIAYAVLPPAIAHALQQEEGNPTMAIIELIRDAKALFARSDEDGSPSRSP